LPVQIALLVQNAALMAELEYQTMLRERARLAREIHDGLAQTIGFLKLQAAQLRTQLENGEAAKARQSAELFYTTLSEAYQDARQAIDGLRVSPDECGLTGWLHQIAGEFQDLSGLPVHLEEGVVEAQVSPEVQAQLIRIVQEALSNVRKHAHASEVWLALGQSSGDLVLEVRDDGEALLRRISPVHRATACTACVSAELIGRFPGDQPAGRGRRAGAPAGGSIARGYRMSRIRSGGG
jgi:two-component system nitrate/nitrite sensor histidine kinase NarX